MGLALALAAAPALRAGAVECAPWPGEMRPLPTAGEADPGRARYARLRAEALAAWARALEARSRTLAHALWRHAACLEPEREDYRAAARRTRPVRVHRPAVRRASAGEEEAAPLPAPAPSEGAALAAPLVVARPEAERALTRGLAALREARFEAALGAVARVRALLAGAEAEGDLRARAEVLAATAELALGREDAARASLRRALGADPALRLDPDVHSPKVVELLEAVRRGRPSGAGPERASARAEPAAGGAP